LAGFISKSDTKKSNSEPCTFLTLSNCVTFNPAAFSLAKFSEDWLPTKAISPDNLLIVTSSNTEVTNVPFSFSLLYTLTEYLSKNFFKKSYSILLYVGDKVSASYI